MAYDESLAGRIRDILRGEGSLVEKRMFGGLAFMLSGNMCVGVLGDDLMVRCAPEETARLLREPGAREMDFTGKAMRGFVVIGPEVTRDPDGLAAWVERAVRFVRTLPAKPAGRKAGTPKAGRRRAGG